MGFLTDLFGVGDSTDHSKLGDYKAPQDSSEINSPDYNDSDWYADVDYDPSDS